VRAELVFSPIASVVRWYRAAKAKFDAYRFEEPTAQFLQTNIPRVKQSVKIYKRLHLGLFYLFGVYYHISKRSAGIEYVRPHCVLCGVCGVCRALC
jgi:hypothetical protein